MLFAARLVAFIAAIYALGSLVTGRALGPSGLSYRSFGVKSAAGLVAGLLLGLLSPSLRALLILIPVLILAGAIAGKRRPDVKAAWRRLKAIERRELLWGGGCTLAVVSAVLGDPIGAHDARSIWYFHAKVIYYGDRILSAPLWSHASQAWSHVDYPKLNAFWAALWTSTFTTWNELVPKASLILLLVPAVCLTLSLAKAPLTRLTLLMLFFLLPGYTIYAGYMDGLLAIYAGLAALFAASYVRRAEIGDFVTMVVCTAVCASLKNEGLIFAALLLGFAFVARLGALKVQGEPWSKQALCPRGGASVLAAVYLPVILWNVWFRAVGLENDLVTATDPLSRLTARLGDGSLKHILASLFPTKVGEPLAVVILATIGLAVSRRAKAKGAWLALIPAFGSAIAYLFVLVGVYLTTPHELSWHLNTSATRTILTPELVILAAYLSLALKPEEY